MNAGEQYGSPSPYAYVPIDPFKPSLAYSLDNILPSRRRDEEDALADALCPPRPRRHTQAYAHRHGQIPQSSNIGGTSMPQAFGHWQGQIPQSLKPAGTPLPPRTIPPRHMAYSTANPTAPAYLRDVMTAEAHTPTPSNPDRTDLKLKASMTTGPTGFGTVYPVSRRESIKSIHDDNEPSTWEAKATLDERIIEDLEKYRSSAGLNSNEPHTRWPSGKDETRSLSPAWRKLPEFNGLTIHPPAELPVTVGKPTERPTHPSAQTLVALRNDPTRQNSTSAHNSGLVADHIAYEKYPRVSSPSSQCSDVADTHAPVAELFLRDTEDRQLDFDTTLNFGSTTLGIDFEDEYAENYFSNGSDDELSADSTQALADPHVDGAGEMDSETEVRTAFPVLTLEHLGRLKRKSRFACISDHDLPASDIQTAPIGQAGSSDMDSRAYIRADPSQPKLDRRLSHRVSDLFPRRDPKRSTTAPNPQISKPPGISSMVNLNPAMEYSIPPTVHPISTNAEHLGFYAMPSVFAFAPPAPTPLSAPSNTPSAQAYVLAFLLDTLPRQVYLYLLLLLPYLYFSRVTRIFEEAEMSMPMIRQGILDAARAKAKAATGCNYGYSHDAGTSVSTPQPRSMPWALGLVPSGESVAYTNLQNTWQGFIDSLLKEWKTLNIISVLLLSAILTILQIESAASDPLTRYSALLSMICALMSLLYGCIYIIRFGTMRKTYKGAEWAQEAQKSRTRIFWNIWVLLAMPATWLAWSMILYVVTIMAFVWRTSPFPSSASAAASTDFIQMSASAQILVPRILISLVLTIGLVYFVLIAMTLRKYGEMMDQAWQKRIWGWMRDGDSWIAGTPAGEGSGREETHNNNAQQEKQRPKNDTVGLQVCVSAKNSALADINDKRMTSEDPLIPPAAFRVSPALSRIEGHDATTRRSITVDANAGKVSQVIVNPASHAFSPTALAVALGPISNPNLCSSLDRPSISIRPLPGTVLDILPVEAPKTEPVMEFNYDQSLTPIGLIREVPEDRRSPFLEEEPVFKSMVSSDSSRARSKFNSKPKMRSGFKLARVGSLLDPKKSRYWHPGDENEIAAESAGLSNISSPIRESQDASMTIKLLDLSMDDPFVASLPSEEDLGQCGLKSDEWEAFKTEVRSALSASFTTSSSKSSNFNHASILPILERWNNHLRTKQIIGEMILREEFGVPRCGWAIYYLSK